VFLLFEHLRRSAAEAGNAVRHFYPAVLIVIASYYVLFAAMSGSLACRTPFAGTSSRTLACPSGGRRGVWRMTSEPQARSIATPTDIRT
jgi:hypothetical protein